MKSRKARRRKGGRTAPSPASPIKVLFRQALALQEQGKLAEAIKDRESENPDARRSGSDKALERANEAMQRAANLPKLTLEWRNSLLQRLEAE